MTIEPELNADTESVCPECLRRVPATRVMREGNLYLRKACPAHGLFETVVWRGLPAYAAWQRPKVPAYPQHPATAVARGCPYDCGLCPDHRQQPCCVLLEVTQRCDLGCPVCFAGAGQDAPASDPSREVVAGWFQRLLEAGGPFNIQFSGGEPCLRDDLPDLIALGRSLGFTFFQVNTNGLRLARDPAYLHRLKAAGLSVVYLQFDSVDEAAYTALRGRPLLDVKRAVLARCAELQLGVVLVPTLVPGVNTAQVGDLLRFAVQHSPTVRGLHFQPITYLGRYPHMPADADRLTLPEVMALLEAQSGGLVRRRDFKPSGGENAHCTFHGNFVVMPDGRLHPLTQHNPSGGCCAPVEAGAARRQAQAYVSRAWAAPQPANRSVPGSLSLGEWEVFLARARTHSLAISGMAFQDAWTLDLDRLRDCYIMTVAPDGRLVPFCAYNLTDRSGRALYRNAVPENPPTP